jgi:hypothetical protein
MIGALLVAVHGAHADPCDSTLTFAPGRAALTTSTKQALEPLRAQLLASPQLHVQIVAAADSLAARRADAAKWFLVDGGIEVDRIATSTTGTARDQVRVQVIGGSCSAMAPAPRPPAGLVSSHDSMVDDASQLASLLAGDEPAKPIAVPRATPPAERLPGPPAVHIGNDDVGFRGSDVTVHVSTAAGGLRLASATLATSAHHEETSVERTSLTDSSDSGEIVDGAPVRLEPKQLRPLARCYRRALGMDPSISNRVNLSFGIDKKGRVLSPVAISDTDELDTCLHAAMKKWQFPAGKPMPQIWLTVALHAGLR